jgi:hypothetical protein
MNKLHFLALLVLAYAPAFSQTCTVTGSPINWPTNGAGIVCAEGGNAVGKTKVIIPAGSTVTFNDATDTWTGPSLEVYGTLNFFANPTTTLSSSLVVNNGGLVNIIGKLALGSGAAGCTYTLIIRTGGRIDVGGTGTDRLQVCGTDIMKGGGGCNSCGGTNSGACPYNGSPYCEPAGGFTGPSGYDDGGYNSTLPVKLIYFLADYKDEQVHLMWATSVEENFYKFIVQRSTDGLTFEDIGDVAGRGFNIYGTETEYAFADVRPSLGRSYYRLKAIDVDETFEYFGVKSVKVEGRKTISVFPNPSSGRVIGFTTNFSPDESDRVILIDQLGNEVFSDLASRIDNSSIVLSNELRPGVYMIRYVSKQFEQTARVIVRN